MKEVIVPESVQHYDYQNYEVLLSDRYTDLGADWEILAQQNTFLSPGYLDAMIATLPDDMEIRFMLVLQNGRPLGINLFQYKTFIPAESLNGSKGRDGYHCALGRYLRRIIQGSVKVKLLVWGNLYLTGQHGYVIDSSQIDHGDFQKLTLDIVEYINSTSKDLSYDVFMIKDLNQRFPEEQNYQLLELKMEPSMDLTIRPEWKSFDDYKGAMSSKYRVRVKRARKKGKELKREILTLEEIDRLTPELHKLYKNITDQVGFNAVALKPGYFSTLARTLPGYTIAGYYLKEELVGFASYLPAEARLEAYYIGLNHEVNRETQLYLNILLDFIHEAIVRGSKELCMSRTAMEIKSSVGAVASEQYCYLHHKRSWGRSIMPFLVRRMNPTDAWTPRHPFK